MLLLLKEILWRLVPQSIGKKLVNFYWKTQKSKSLKWILLNVYVLDQCNLNCKSCNSFAPLSKIYKLDKTSFENDCRRLSSLGESKIPEIHFLGGEPLLHPDLLILLEIARKYFKKSKLQIITNGILLLRQNNSFWERLKEIDVGIIISHYPINLELKKIKKIANNNKLSIRYYKGELPWFKMAFDLNGTYSNEENYKRCNAALQSIELKDGKLAACQYIQKIHYFNNYFDKQMEVVGEDVLDIYSVNNFDEILKFLSKAPKFCRYCTLKSIPIEWGISKKEITEWT
ncbi:MAG: hypothetical protein Ta2D_13850 [Rickettsiales bacterium]|nr:MAG: hypothetical protein Ta2D_13850 [Rickettsiales bacterium]